MASMERARGQTIKVVILGDTGVGKSSLALRFVSDEFRPYSDSTIGASYMAKSISVVPEQEPELSKEDPKDDDNGEEEEETGDSSTPDVGPSTTSTPLSSPRTVHFKIWDTAGQEKYRSLAPMYYRGAGAALLVYDVTTSSTFATLQGWVNELRRNGPPDIVMGVCGNKTDLGSREVDEDQARDYAEQTLGCFYVETSAKTNTNVYDAFVNLAKRIPYETNDDIMSDMSESNNQGGFLNIGDSPSNRQGCC